MWTSVSFSGLSNPDSSRDSHIHLLFLSDLKEAHEEQIKKELAAERAAERAAREKLEEEDDDFGGNSKKKKKSKTGKKAKAKSGPGSRLFSSSSKC